MDIETDAEHIWCDSILQHTLAHHLITRPVKDKKNNSVDNQQKTIIQQHHFSVKSQGLTKPITHVKDFDITPYSESDIAKQLTMLEFNIFKKIEPKEFFKKGWNKKEVAPNVVQLTKQFNNVSSWVGNVILTEKNIKRRKEFIRKFIEIATHMRKLGNFSGVNQIVSGLVGAHVHRLRKTWELVPPKYHQMLEELTDLMSGKGSYKALREEITTTQPPCIPFVGVYLTDLTFIEDGNPDLIKPTTSADLPMLINFNKRKLVAKTIKEIQRCQTGTYSLPMVTDLYDALKTLVELPSLLNAEQLYVKSLEVEPKPSAVPISTSQSISSPVRTTPLSVVGTPPTSSGNTPPLTNTPTSSISSYASSSTVVTNTSTSSISSATAMELSTSTNAGTTPPQTPGELMYNI